MDSKRVLEDALRDGEPITYGMTTIMVLIAYVQRLRDALGNLPCSGGGCGHPLALHLGENGCIGDDGTSTPCGCVGGSRAEDAAIEALRAARNG